MKASWSFLALAALSPLGCGARTSLDDGLHADVAASDGGAVDGATCGSPGENVTLASLPPASGENTLPVALGETDVYWLYAGSSGMDGGSVMSVPKCGGAVVTLATGQPFLSAIAVDAENVYWINVSDGNNGSVMRLPLQGNTPVTVATGGGPSGVAVDATSVYWTQASAGMVMKLAKSGGAPVTLATGQLSASDLAVNATHACWTINDLDFADEVPGVVCVPSAGGTPVTLASGSSLYWSLALDETTAYSFSGDGSGVSSVFAVPLAGGTPLTLGSGLLQGLAVDQTYVYWTTAGTSDTTGAVLRVAKDGGVPVTLVTGQDDPGSIAVDAQRIYWTEDPSAFVDAGPAVLAGPK